MEAIFYTNLEYIFALTWVQIYGLSLTLGKFWFPSLWHFKRWMNHTFITLKRDLKVNDSNVQCIYLLRLCNILMNASSVREFYCYAGQPISSLFFITLILVNINSNIRSCILTVIYFQESIFTFILFGLHNVVEKRPGPILSLLLHGWGTEAWLAPHYESWAGASDSTHEVVSTMPWDLL